MLVAAEALWHLGSLFYRNTQYSQSGWFTNLFWCDIPWNKAQHRPTSHLARLYTEPFLWPWDEHRRQRSWVDDFAGQFWYRTFVAAALGLPTNWEVGQSWLLPASSIKFLARRSLKSQWVYLATHEGNSIQLLSTVRSRRWKNNFLVHSKVQWLIE